MKTFTRIALLGMMLAVLMLTASSLAHLYTPIGGYVKQDTTLKKEESPYILTDNLIVDEGITLTVEPGVTIFGNDSLYTRYAIIVDGTLDAQGTEDDSIRFDCLPKTWQWRGIILNDGSVGTLKYCLITNANLGVECRSLQLVNIDNCLIEAEIYGIELLGDSPSASKKMNQGPTEVLSRPTEVSRPVVSIKETTIGDCWIGIITLSPVETVIHSSTFEATNKIAISCRANSSPIIKWSELHAPITSSSSESIDATNNSWTKSTLDIMEKRKDRSPLIDYSEYKTIGEAAY